MSYAFDTLSIAWAKLRAELPKETKFGDVAVYFEFLIEEIHEANHRMKDAINKDDRVTRSAQRLDNAMKGT